MFAQFRSTERHLRLLKVPFVLKKRNYIPRTFNTGLNDKRPKPAAPKEFFRRPIKLRKLTTLTEVTKAPVQNDLLNPSKAEPQNLEQLAIEPIKPLTAPRFSKNVDSLPSVTKILSATMPAASQFILDRWKEAMIKKLGAEGFNKYQQETFERGRILHSLIASYLMGQGGPVEISKEVVANLWSSIEKVVKEDITNVRLVEHVVTHAAMRYRGIVDCVACYKGELVVIDFKTAEKPKKSVASLYDNPLQVTAYCGAINNDKNIPLSVIDRNICAGLVIVAYTDGSKASLHYLGRDKVKDDYWKEWLTRLDQFGQMEALRKAQTTN